MKRFLGSSCSFSVLVEMIVGLASTVAGRTEAPTQADVSRGDLTCSSACCSISCKKVQKAAETTTSAPANNSSSPPRKGRGKPGDRNPGRDNTGEYMHEGDDAPADDVDEQEAAG